MNTPRARLATALALVLSLADYAQGALRHAGYNWKAYNGDQNSYLRLALRIHEGEGFTNGNFHPLVALLFSPFASRDWSFFTQAKLVSVAAGGLALGLVFGFGRRLFGSATALVTVAVLALNETFTLRAARVEPEALLVGLFFAAWACWVLSLEQPRWAVAAGALAGLAYLTKGSGQFLLLGSLLLPLLRHGPAGWWRQRRALAWFVAAYLLVASPLLLDNWRAFGSPFYAFPSAHAMWYDEWEDKLGSTDGRHITLRTYLASHTTSDVVDRLAEGLSEVPPEWAGAFTLGVPAGTAWILGLALLAALALAFTGRPGPMPDPGLAPLAGRLRSAAWTLVALVPAYCLFFVWYAPIANSSRFVLPLVPGVTLCLVALTALALRRWLPRLAAVADRGWTVPAAVGAVMALALIQGEWRRPTEIMASDLDNNRASIDLLRFLGQSASPGGETVVWGPGDLATWTLHGQVTFRPLLAEVVDWPDLAPYMASLGAQRIVLAPEMVEKREEALGAYFRVENDSVTWDRLPPGWQLRWRGPADGCHYCVFEIEAAR